MSSPVYEPYSPSYEPYDPASPPVTAENVPSVKITVNEPLSPVYHPRSPVITKHEGFSNNNNATPAIFPPFQHFAPHFYPPPPPPPMHYNWQFNNAQQPPMQYNYPQQPSIQYNNSQQPRAMQYNNSQRKPQSWNELNGKFSQNVHTQEPRPRPPPKEYIATYTCTCGNQWGTTRPQNDSNQRRYMKCAICNRSRLPDHFNITTTTSNNNRNLEKENQIMANGWNAIYAANQNQNN